MNGDTRRSLPPFAKATGGTRPSPSSRCSLTRTASQSDAGGRTGPPAKAGERERVRAPKYSARSAFPHLTEAQRAAVTFGTGPALVLAGAGTGKTRVLVERVKWLIGHRRVPPQNILALTFTEKAAEELETRIDLALPISVFRPWVGTFHGFAESVLREQAFSIGLTTHFRILSPPEAWLLLKRNLFSLPLARFRPLGNPTRFAPALVEFFSQAKDQGVTAEMLDAYAGSREQGGESRETGAAGDAEKWKELAAVYRAYVDLQRKEGVMDFGDLMAETLRLFRERPAVLRTYRKRFPYIVVDEFQDTNTTQFQLLKLLAGSQGNLLASSDDDQAIFAFRGSNVANVLAFHEQFPSAALIVLTDNFRSPQLLLDHAHQLIQRNNPHRLEATKGISKRLTSRIQKSASRIPDKVAAHRHFATEEEELAWVAEEILRLVERGVGYREIAVLTRTNALAAEFVTSLTRRDIPHVVTEARGLLARPEVKDVLAYFRLLADPLDGRALFRLLTHPAFAIPSPDRATLLGALRQRRSAVLSLLRTEDVRRSLSLEARAGVDRLTEVLSRHLSDFRTLRPSQVYLEFLERSGILKHAIQGSARYPEVLPNFQAFLAYIRSLEPGSAPGDLFEFLDILETAADTGEGPRAAALAAETDAVRVLTVHAAKGLEFPYVFMIGTSMDRFPTRNRAGTLELPSELVPLGVGLDDLDDREAHILEERRLFYVALTRAQKRMILTSSTAAAGRRQRRKPSPFIAEAGIPTEYVEQGTTDAGEQLALPLAVRDPPAPAPPAPEVLTLSASKVTEYLTCPLKYRFRYVLKVPTPPQATLSFGNTIHAVLHDMAVARMTGQTPTVEDALRWFEGRWISDGYESPPHEQTRKQAGRAALRTYLEAHPEILTNAPVAVEVPFSLALPTVRLTGRIDRVDQAGRENPRAVIVTDFKTGEGSARDAESDLQLSIYALAVRQALGREPVSLRFSYVETGRDEATTRTPEQDAEAAARVEAVAERIRSGEFTATPGYHCRFCDFRQICDYAQLS